MKILVDNFHKREAENLQSPDYRFYNLPDASSAVILLALSDKHFYIYE